MSRTDKNELDRAVAELNGAPIDPEEVERAAARVWERLSAEAGAPPIAASSALPDPRASLRGCTDFQALIPAYLAAELPPARALLLEDHTRSCIPCRRALREAREGRPTLAARPAARAAVGRHRALLGLAAAGVAVLALGLFFLLEGTLFSGSRMARVESLDGGLYRVAGATSTPVKAGDGVVQGEEIRTAKGSTALVRMNDGSLIEMSERAGLSLDAGLKGNTIRLDGGRIIVQAAKQRPRHLYVATDDCLVSVTGTIFSVNRGTKGSRVSVIEGEVHVQQAKLESILHPGDQVATRANVAAVPVRREIAWSRDAARYQSLLTDLTALGKQIDQEVTRPGLRTSTQLLDLAPAGTTLYIALPNLATTLRETQRKLDQHIADSPSLQQWWSDTLGSSDNETRFHQMIERLGDLGQNLGDELAIAITPQAAGGTHAGAPVLYATVVNDAAFRAALAQEVATINASHGKTVLQIVDDPAAAAGTADGTGILLWVGQGLFVASPSATQLAAVAANLQPGAVNPFAASSFRSSVAQVYQDGAGWLFSADLAQLVTRKRADTPGFDKTAQALGVADLDNFILNCREGDGRIETRAAIAFSQTRRGVASWLAAPAPMGSLRFFSPDANLVTAFVVRSPVSLLDELLQQNPDFAAGLAKIDAESGLDLRNDLAAPLGGEVAFGVDGPVLPTPSWKVVIEVLDPVHLEQTIEKAVALADQKLKANGKPGLQLTQEQSGGNTYYAIVSADAGKPEVHYLFADGYLVAAPSRALLDLALAQRASGVTLASASKLRDLLGPDGQVNVSALVYQNLAPVVDTFGKALPATGAASAGHGPGAALHGILSGLTKGPGLIYAYGEDNRILIAGSSEYGPLGVNLGSLAGFGKMLGALHQAHGAAAAQAGAAR